ncbi:MAG: FecR domain-containing protein [Deltaproteobacteria bacterium]|nr:FecR domain-containing protein [Deltaproteobacteria bacterium]MBW2077252.1 FecR domain-containing protein [Deltaproteobacteria bacterium]MBW2311878.1 FecR domain-containing protein [Deltaproteobacteria bacterium]
MKKILFHACVVSLVIVFVLPQLSFSKENQLGHVTHCSGDIQIKRAKQNVWQRLALNMPVCCGDIIKTSEKSTVEIALADRGSFKIHPNTQVALNTIISPVERANSFLLFFGRLWIKIHKYTLRLKGYEIQTPTGFAGLRGTELGIASYEDGSTLVRVNSGRVIVDNEVDRKTLSSNEGAALSFQEKEIKIEHGFQPEWERTQRASRQRLFSDGEKYGTTVRSEIDRRKDHLKDLIEKANQLSEEKDRYLSLAREAGARGDDLEYESCMSEANNVNERLKKLNRQIAFYGRRLECHFGLFYHYGYLARHPEYSKEFMGKEFILKELDNIEMIHAEFNAMIEEGLKMTMEDMEDLMDEMKEKVKGFRK